MKIFFSLNLTAFLLLLLGCAKHASSADSALDEKFLSCHQQENDYMIQYSWLAPRENGCCGKGAMMGVKEIWKPDEGIARTLVSSEPMSAKEIQKKFCKRK